MNYSWNIYSHSAGMKISKKYKLIYGIFLKKNIMNLEIFRLLNIFLVCQHFHSCLTKLDFHKPFSYPLESQLNMIHFCKLFD